MELHSRMNRGSTAANVTLVDKKQSDYEEPIVQKPKVISFSGTAQKLGDRLVLCVCYLLELTLY